MRRFDSARVTARSRSLVVFCVPALGLALSAAACGSDEGGVVFGGAGTTQEAGAAGSNEQPSAGSGGTAGGTHVAGAAGTEAGASGDVGAAGSAVHEAGAAGAAGEPPVVTACEPGGALFVVGNYVNSAGDELFLRATASAATLALVPKAPALPAKPPQLFAVERVCAAAGSLVVRDAASRYRLDFLQSGSKFSLCLSAPVATLDLAAHLPPADWAHASDTGCAGKPFASYTAEAL